MSLRLAPHRKQLVPPPSADCSSAHVRDAAKRRPWYETFAEKGRVSTRRDYEQRYGLTSQPGRRSSIDPEAARVAPEREIIEKVRGTLPSELPLTYVYLPKDYFLHKFKRHPITGKITLACDHPWTDFTLVDLKVPTARNRGIPRLAAKGVTSPIEINTLSMSEIACDPFYFKATILPMRSWYFTSLMEQKHTEWSAQVSQKKGQLKPPKQHDIFLQSLKASLVDTPVRYVRGSHSTAMLMAPLLFTARLVSASATYLTISAAAFQWGPILCFFLGLLSSVKGNNCYYYRLQRASSAPLRWIILVLCIIELMHAWDAASSLNTFEIIMILITLLLLVIDIITGDLTSLVTSSNRSSRIEVLVELPGRVYLCRRLGSHKNLPQGVKNKSLLVSSTVSSRVVGLQLAVSSPPDLCIVAYIEGALVELTPIEAGNLKKLSESCQAIIKERTSTVPPVVRILSTGTFSANNGR